MSVLRTHLYQCTSLHCCERLCLASVNFFFEDSFNAFAHFMGMMGDLWVYLPTPSRVFICFWPKLAWPPCPPSLFTHSCPEWLFFLSPVEKVPQREMFCPCGVSGTNKQTNKNNSRSTKRHQNWRVQKLFWAVGKMSQWVYFIKWRVLWGWLKFKHVRINTHFFINKLCFWTPFVCY